MISFIQIGRTTNQTPVLIYAYVIFQVDAIIEKEIERYPIEHFQLNIIDRFYFSEYRPSTSLDQFLSMDYITNKQIGESR